MLQLRGRRAELDLLRAAAIVGVLFLHNLYDWQPGTMAAALGLWHLAAWSVLLFFFLSGLLSRPLQRQHLARRWRRSLELLLTWFVWGVAYTLTGALAQRLHWVPPIPNLFSPSWPFFSFAYQLYFLALLALIQGLQTLWLALLARCAWSPRRQAVLEWLCAAALLAITVHGGWPPVPHGSFPALYPLYALAYLAGMLQAHGLRWSLSLSLLTLLVCVSQATVAGAAWFLILLPALTLLLSQLMRALPPLAMAPIALVSACSGSIYLLHHPLLLPLLRRFWRLWGLPDGLNYGLCILMACLLPILLVLGLRPWLRRWPWLARLLLVPASVVPPPPPPSVPPSTPTPSTPKSVPQPGLSA